MLTGAGFRRQATEAPGESCHVSLENLPASLIHGSWRRRLTPFLGQHAPTGIDFRRSSPESQTPMPQHVMACRQGIKA